MFISLTYLCISGNFPHICDECGKGYMQKGKVVECKNTHAGIFRLQCAQCDYKTNFNREFRRHQTIHQGEKKFKCPICPSHVTHNSGALQSHTRKVHKMTLVKAETLTRKNRFGEEMSEADLQAAIKQLETSQKTFETCRLRQMNGLKTAPRPKTKNNYIE